jgi:hypothetical protein
VEALTRGVQASLFGGGGLSFARPVIGDCAKEMIDWLVHESWVVVSLCRICSLLYIMNLSNP